MGLLDDKDNKSQIKSTKDIANYEIKGKKGTNRLLFDFENNCTFKHGDELTNLIKARILDNYKKGNSTSPDSAKYMCFEISTDTYLDELIQNSIFDILEGLGKFANLAYGEYNHVGIILKNEDGEYELYSPTNEVLQYVKDNLNKEITKSEKLFSERIRGQEFKTRISEPTNEYINYKKEIINMRKKNVFLEEQYRYKIGDEIYTDYIGTDVTEGKILKINRLNEVKQVQGENIYSTFIEKKDEETEEETMIMDRLPKGFPILFTLANTLESYLKNGDEKEITKILQLITDLPKEKLNVKHMIYIGGIDKKGNIHRNIENCLEETKKEISEQQRKYKEIVNQQQLSRI